VVETHIRPAREGDAELLLDLIKELAEYEKVPDAVTGDAELLRRSLFEEHAAEALVVEADAEPVGYAIFFTTFSTWECRPGIWLEDVYVRPEHRRGGVGRLVLAHLAALAVERGYNRVDWCALNWNEPALNFYKRIGAVPLDEWQMLRLEGEALAELSRRPPAPL
jgi:GNAT superfamily N-acetyltransferase